MKEHAFLKHAAVYGLASMLVRAGSIVLVPLYLHTMDQEENGVVEILDRLAETVGTVLLIGGLRQALLTFYQQTDDEQERRKVFGSAMLLVFAFSAVIGGAALAFAQPITELLATKNGAIPPNLLRLAVLAILLEPLSLMPLSLVQSRVQSSTFLVISVSQFLVRVLLCLLLVGWFQLGAWGVLSATVTTSAAYGVVLTGRELLRNGTWPTRSHVLALLRFALPFLPGGLGFLMMQHGDRFFLLKCYDEAEVATYGLGYKLALGVGMFSLAPLYMVWSSSMYKAARAADAPAVFGRAFTRILAAYVMVGLCLCLFAEDVVGLLGDARYAHAADVIPVVVLACFCQTAAALMDAGFYVSRRSGLKVGITLSATFFMSVLYCVLIPPYGSMGAALATLGGFGCLAAVTLAVTQLIFPVRYEWHRLVCMLALAGAAWLLSRFVPAAWSWSPLRLALFAAVPLIAWHCGLVSPAEINYLRALADKLARSLRAGGRVASAAPGPRAAAPSVHPASHAGRQLVLDTEDYFMETSFFGGFVRPLPSFDRAANYQQGAGQGRRVWRYGDLLVRASEPCCRLYTWHSLALVIRGTVRLGSDAGGADLDRVAQEIRSRYLEQGDLFTSGLEGSFTLALLDGLGRRILLYRNLVGAGFTYYHACPAGLLFGSNLVHLVDAVGGPGVNAAALPAYFISRFVPGRETLFDGIYRLLPGEQLTWDEAGLHRAQRQTFATFRDEPIPPAKAVARLEATMDEVLDDYAARQPDTVNLLSGGVDSSYLQVVWNRLRGTSYGLPDTYSVSVDHARTWPDADYAVSAAALLGTRHRLVPADGPYACYLLDLIGTTGEPPNHVQSAYFGHLADTLVAGGKQTALCGEGADSLFGLGLANQLHNAGIARAFVPSRAVRQGAAALAGLAGCGRVRDTLWLADNLGAFDHAAHPVNRAAVFTDWPAVQACFGTGAVQNALAKRRALLDHFGVPADPMDRLHAIGYLAEATDSASLWTTLFNRAGADLFCPFLDSRLLRFVASLAPEARFRFRRPKALLKAALVRNGAGALAHRAKLGFGQPIFEWLAPGGQLRPLVERIGRYDFVDRRAWQFSLAQPNWFLYSLLCFDLWHKLFIDRSLPRDSKIARERLADVPAGATL
jgi:O-antigen/teichoic acid export membrane protein/asparagine synthetase B (glutamine-hydrolysing)